GSNFAEANPACPRRICDFGRIKEDRGKILAILSLRDSTHNFLRKCETAAPRLKSTKFVSRSVPASVLVGQSDGPAVAGAGPACDDGAVLHSRFGGQASGAT